MVRELQRVGHQSSGIAKSKRRKMQRDISNGGCRKILENFGNTSIPLADKE